MFRFLIRYCTLYTVKLLIWLESWTELPQGCQKILIFILKTTLMLSMYKLESFASYQGVLTGAGVVTKCLKNVEHVYLRA